VLEANNRAGCGYEWKDSMNPLQAIVLGIIQGLTEFLPISSTAHLRVAPALLGWDDPGAAFTAVIQLGTLLAVLVYFRHDIARLVAAFVRGIVNRQPFAEQDSRLAWMIAAGTIPIVIAGLAFKKHIESTLRSLYVISAALIVLALLMVAAEELVRIRQRSRAKEKTLDNLGWLDAILVGICQAFALIPGTSRSGVTITGGLFLGMTREAAARFSFLLSLPAVLAAAVLELYRERDQLLSGEGAAVNLLLATGVSAVVGYASIAFLLQFLKSHTMHLFVVYRIALGVILLILVSSGRVPAEEKSHHETRNRAPSPVAQHTSSPRR
jgi:undecaprenyl-diphosphatase